MTSNRFFPDKFQRRPGNNQWRNNNHQNGKSYGRCFTGLQGFGKRGRSAEHGLKYSQQRNGPGTDRNQQVGSGGKRKGSSSPHEIKGKLDVRPRESQVITNICSLIKSAVAGNRVKKQNVVPDSYPHRTTFGRGVIGHRKCSQLYLGGSLDQVNVDCN
jgi:hypothetical protein